MAVADKVEVIDKRVDCITRRKGELQKRFERALNQCGHELSSSNHVPMPALLETLYVRGSKHGMSIEEYVRACIIVAESKFGKLNEKVAYIDLHRYVLCSVVDRMVGEGMHLTLYGHAPWAKTDALSCQLTCEKSSIGAVVKSCQHLRGVLGGRESEFTPFDLANAVGCLAEGLDPWLVYMFEPLGTAWRICHNLDAPLKQLPFYFAYSESYEEYRNIVMGSSPGQLVDKHRSLQRRADYRWWCGLTRVLREVHEKLRSDDSMYEGVFSLQRLWDVPPVTIPLEV